MSDNYKRKNHIFLYLLPLKPLGVTGVDPSNQKENPQQDFITDIQYHDHTVLQRTTILMQLTQRVYWLNKFWPSYFKPAQQLC